MHAPRSFRRGRPGDATRPTGRGVLRTAIGLIAAITFVASCGTPDPDGAPAITTPHPSVTVGPAQTPAPASATAQPTATPNPPPTPDVGPRTGAEALADDDFGLLHGKRVGLIANQTSLVDGVALAVRLAEHPDVDLRSLFAPEHGVTGAAGAGDVVDDARDALLGVPVYSLYGDTRAPTPEALADIDVLVYDLQDVGTRFYTYISTMGLAMQAAAAAGVDFVVLERPNPQGRELAGFVRDDAHESFVSQFPVPISYGMTSGELAWAIVGEEWMPGVAALDLTVVQLLHVDRRVGVSDMAPWVPPSPALPTAGCARAYPGTGLFEATSVSEGRGTDAPFLTIGARWIEGDALASTLTDLGLPGVAFTSTVFVPEQLATLTAPPRFDGEELHGVRLDVHDPAAFRSVETGVHLLVAVQRQATAVGLGSIVERPDGFDLLAGTPVLRTMLESEASADEIIAAWAQEATRFAMLRERYLLH